MLGLFRHEGTMSAAIVGVFFWAGCCHALTHVPQGAGCP